MARLLTGLMALACVAFWLWCFLDAVRRPAGEFKAKIVDEAGANKFLWLAIVALMPTGSILYGALVPKHRVDKALSGFHVAALGTAFVPFVGWIFSLVLFLTGLMQSRGRRAAAGAAVGAMGVGLSILMALVSVSVHRSILGALEGHPSSAPWAETHLFKAVVSTLRDTASR